MMGDQSFSLPSPPQKPRKDVADSCGADCLCEPSDLVRYPRMILRSLSPESLRSSADLNQRTYGVLPY
jgi:hypothetical protein